MTKNIYCVIGKSGTGKDTIVNGLCRKYGYKRVVSYTTRKQRNDPNDADSHLFATVNDYKRDKENGIIVADTLFDGNYYWVTQEQLDNSDLYIIDIDGYKTMRIMYDKRPMAVILVNADKDVRKERMRIRGDKDSKIEQRIKHDEKAFSNIEMLRKVTDIIVSNNYAGNVDAMIDKVHSCIQTHEDNTKTNAI